MAPDPREAQPSRRAVLASTGALALTACLPATDDDPERPDPDLRLRTRVAAEVSALVEAYAAAASAAPALAARLAPLAAETAAHVTALRGPRPTPGPSRGSPVTPTPPVVPDGAAATQTTLTMLNWLAGLERAAARRRSRQSLRAGGDLARLLASVGACESVHAMLLEGPA